MYTSEKILIPKVGRFLYETAILNGKSHKTYFEDYDINSNDILFEYSKQLPRKKKKYLRSLL